MELPLTILAPSRRPGIPAGATGSAGRDVAPPAATAPMLSFIDAWLQEQQSLSAVERFAQLHDAGEARRVTSPVGSAASPPAPPAQSRYYRDLLPVQAPKPGQQYAFDVDLDSCTGCKACVTACHSLNGLDDGETFREVGLLVGGTSELPILQHVTAACHHCVDPACLTGCPVNAYDKDPVTGIVKHLDDQCIGCQYCVFKCPYDVPKYNARLGIVRKCDMCSDRLAAGEAPACVQACPNQAIRITVVDQQRVADDAEANLFVPGAPDPGYTLPTTNYRTRRVLPRNLLPADYHTVAPQHPHLPLVAMLVLTQLSVGAFAVERVLRELGLLTGGGAAHAITALGLGLLALVASTLHLGRPMYAFRAVVGLRTSWLSREILAFGMYAGAAALYAAHAWFHGPASGAWSQLLNTGVVATGALGVFCSVMIYHDTRRAFWTFPQSATKFLLTAAALGIATTLLTATVSGLAPLREVPAGGLVDRLCRTLALVMLVKLAFESLVFLRLRDRQHTSQRRTAGLLRGPLGRITAVRFGLGALGGVILPMALVSTPQVDAPAMLVGIFLMTGVGEFLERYLYFAAVVAPKMPGGGVG